MSYGYNPVINPNPSSNIVGEANVNVEVEVNAPKDNLSPITGGVDIETKTVYLLIKIRIM